jgi:signal transduction histidine kinase
MNFPALPTTLHGLRAQVLLWTVLPATILFIVFSLTGVSSHVNSMRLLAEEEHLRLVQALSKTVSLQIDNYALRSGTPITQVSVDDLQLDQLLQMNHPHSVSRILLFDNNGHVLFSRGTLSAPENILDWPGISKTLAGETGALFTSEAAHGDIIAYAPVIGTDWYLVTRESWHSLTDPLIRFEQVMPYILFAATVISFLTLFFGLRFVAQPLHKLGLIANQIGQGNFEAAAMTVGGVKEIEDLRKILHEMANQVQNYQMALHDYLREITQAQEEERARLGRELHDETVQTLIALGHKAQMAQRNWERSSPQTGETIVALRQMIAQGIEEVRRFSRAIHPHFLEELGFVTAVEALAREVGAQFSVLGSPRRIQAEKELALYRIAQEALNNARRHGQAKIISVEVEFCDDTVLLQIEDDGVGFDLPSPLHKLTGTGHFGLMGMHERSQLVGGNLMITSIRNKGTKITIAVAAESFQPV